MLSFEDLERNRVDKMASDRVVLFLIAGDKELSEELFEILDDFRNESLVSSLLRQSGDLRVEIRFIVESNTTERVKLLLNVPSGTQMSCGNGEKHKLFGVFEDLLAAGSVTASEDVDSSVPSFAETFESWFISLGSVGTSSILSES